MKSPKRRRLERRTLPPELLEARIAPATLFVDNTNDAGAGSLRQAILTANSTPGADEIRFDGVGATFPTSGPLVIALQTPLPVITETLTIDGYTAAGTSPNTANIGSNAVLRVMLDGSLAGGNGLVFFEDADSNANGSVVRGLVISGFNPGIGESGFGVFIKADNVTVAGNFIGTDITGTQIFSGVNSGGTTITGNRNAGVGIGLFGAPGTYDANVIGGIDPADRNVLSGNSLGISLSTLAQGTSIFGNLIGTDKTGTVALPNDNAGIRIGGGATTIGGLDPGASNVISGNNRYGIDFGVGSGLIIQGNLIGVMADGVTPLPNQGAGIRLQNSGSNVAIGGSTPTAANIIAANFGAGIQIGSDVGDGPANMVTVQGNFIGTDKTGARPLGNQGGGIAVTGSTDSLIGGTAVGEGNVIAFNNGAGIRVAEETGPSQVQILGNGLRNNTGLGIDLVGENENFAGVTLNDTRDLDVGPNQLTNWPVLEFVSNSGTAFALDVNVLASPSTPYRIEFFAVAPNQVDPSGHGEGTLYLGSLDVLTNGSGLASANFAQTKTLPQNTRFTATITSISAGVTSEFSAAVGPADTYTWNGSQSPNWFDPANWTSSGGGSGVPGPLDTAIYGAGAINPIQLDASASVFTFQHSAGQMLGTGQLTVRNSLSWTGGSQDGPGLLLGNGATGLIDGGAGNALQWNKGNFDIFGSATLDGGGLTFDAGMINIDAAGALTLNAGIVDPTPAAVGSLSFVANNGKIAKLGSGTFGFNTTTIDSSGIIEARAGTLVLGNYTGFGDSQLFLLPGGNVQAISTLTLDTDAQLLGSGVITGDVNNLGGFISPGGDGVIGTLGINGTYTQGDSGTLLVDIRSAAQGTGYDQLNVQGLASIDGVLNVGFLPGYTSAIGDTFNLVLGAPLTGTFETVVGEGVLADNYTATAARLVRAGQTFTWTGLFSADPDNWNQPGNWDLNAVPGPGDLARLNNSGTINLDTGNVTVGDFVQSNGMLTGPNNLTTLGSFQWIGGTQSGTGTTLASVGSSMVINTGPSKTLDGRTLSIQGTGSVGAGAPLTLSNDGLVLVGGLLDLQNSNPFVVGSGGGRLEIENEGVFRKSVAGAASLGAALNVLLDGTLEVPTGSLLFTSTGSATSGIFRVASGATLQFNSPTGFNVTPDSVFEGGGTVQIAGGTLNITTGSPVFVAADTTFELAAGALTTALGNFVVDGNFRWSGGAISGGVGGFVVNGSFDILGSATKTLSQWQLLAAGGGQWSGTGNVSLDTGANIDISGTILIDGDFSVQQGAFAGALEILPAGALEVDSATVVIAPLLQSAGTFRASTSADVTFTNGFLQSAGTLFIDAGSIITTPASVGIGGGFVFGEGTIAGTLDNGGGIVSPGSALNDSGVLTVTGNYIQGAGGTLLIEARGPSPGSGYDQLVVSGTEDLDGAITFMSIGSFSVPIPSTFNVLTGASGRTGMFNQENLPPGGSVAYNAGGANVVFAAGSQTFVWDGDVDNDWFNPLNWDLNAGVPGATDTAVLSNGGTITLTGNASVGTFNLSSGVFGGAASLTILGDLSWSGGTMTGTGTTSVAGAASLIDGTGTKFLSRRLENSGTLTIASPDASGEMRLGLTGLPGVFANLAGGTVNVTAGSEFANSAANPGQGIINAGTWTISGAGTVSNFTTDFNNTNAVNVNSGALELTSGTSTGTYTVAGAASLTFVGDLHALSGTINGSFTNSGATIAVGGSGTAGTLTVTGNYTQGAGGTLEVELGGTSPGQFDVLSIGGTADLGGLFVGSTINGFSAAVGQTFVVMTYANVLNDFSTATAPSPLTANKLTTSFQLSAAIALDPLVVNTELDVVDPVDAFTSLREAIIFANSNTGLDTITFAIPGASVHTIALASALPTITDALVIDGYSQTGSANTESLNTFDAVVTIVIDGSGAAGGSNGLELVSGSSGSTIKGVAVQNFGGVGLRITSDNNLVTGIIAGGATSEDANAGGGIFVSGTGNKIGGSARADRNLISGNGGHGVLLNAASQTRIEGNFIGTDASGTAALTNLRGVILANGSTQNVVTGNVISGNTEMGIEVNNASQNTITKNLIGTATNGTGALGNALGVLVTNGASNNTIGGLTPGEGNTILFNTGGVNIEGAGTIGNKVLGNTIVNAPGNIGIDLGTDATTPNDPTDSDTGPNNLINFPVLTSAVPNGSNVDVTGSLTVAVSGTVRIEFFLASTGVFLGAKDAVSVAGSPVAFSTTLTGVSAGDQIVATTTDFSLDGTSEISAAVTVIPPVLISISDAAIVEGDSGTKQLVFKVTLNQAVPATVTVNYDTAAFSADARSAAAGVDYLGVTSGLVIFGPNELSQTISIAVNGDIAAEPTERFNVVLSNATNAGIDDDTGIGAILDDDHHTIAVAEGSGNQVSVYTTTPAGATLVKTFTAFDPKFKGGVRVAVGDVNGDGVDDVIAGAGLGGRAKVRVFDGANDFQPMAGVLGEFAAFGRTYRGGVFVAAGDVDGDGKDDVIVSPSAGSLNRVNIFSGDDGALLSSFRAFGKGTGGVRVTAGDVNGDGLAEIIVGTGVGSSVRVFDALNGMALDDEGAQFRAFGKNYRGGVFVAAGDLNADGKDDIIVSAGAGAPHIRSYLQGIPPVAPKTFDAYTGPKFGARVGVLDINADGIADIISSKGRKGDNLVRVFDGLSTGPMFSISPLSRQPDGLYIG